MPKLPFLLLSAEQAVMEPVARSPYLETSNSRLTLWPVSKLKLVLRGLETKFISSFQRTTPTT